LLSSNEVVAVLPRGKEGRNHAVMVLLLLNVATMQQGLLYHAPSHRVTCNKCGQMGSMSACYAYQACLSEPAEAKLPSPDLPKGARSWTDHPVT
jgi:hypothetical protein